MALKKFNPENTETLTGLTGAEGRLSFRDHIRSSQLARTERFECIFEFPASMTDVWNELQKGSEIPSGQNLKLESTIMCEEVQIPGMVLQNKEVSIGTWQFMRNSNVAFLGNEINFTFLTDTEWKLRHVFEAWIGHCVDPQSKRVAFPDDQFGQVWINMLNMEDKVQTTWLMHEVTPKVLNLVPLATGATSIARTTLIISSAYWESKTVAIDLNEECVGPAPKKKVVPYYDGWAAYTAQETTGNIGGG